MVALEDIRLGDTVRLRNGETIYVASKMTKVSDRDGEHEGPFIAARGHRDRYSLGDVAEVVERNERLCVYCGEGVTATNPETTFCRGCFYTGVAHEQTYAEILGRLRGIRNVASADVWHTGGGCFVLAITLSDGRLITPSAAYQEDPVPGFREGTWAVDASLPEPGTDERWGIVVSRSEDAWNEWDDESDDIRVVSDRSFSDDELVAYVAALADGRRAGMLELPAERPVPYVYVANVLGDDLLEEPREIGSVPLPVGDEGVVIQYGDRDGVCVYVEANDEQDAERRIIATFSDSATIDDLQLAAMRDS